MMASECEASCESDSNFACICAFIERFGELCGIESIDCVELQSMLENNQEVSQKLIDLHIKLLRKIKKTVSPERWERALVNVCHIFSSKDAWEIERFGYKKTKLSIKIRALKELLEMQFDYNSKFKNEVNKLTAEELRAQPLGRDKLGRAYWFQTDKNYQIRIYKEDPDEETWKLIAKDREGLSLLISELTDGDSKLSSDSAGNEDSNSLLDKPFTDTGQNESSNEGKVKDEDTSFLRDQSSSDSKTNDCLKVSEKTSGDVEKEQNDLVSSSFTFKNKSNNGSPDAKKMKLEISPEIESSELIIKGAGSGVENESSNLYKIEQPLIIGEEIEEPVMFFRGEGSGMDCKTGNEKDGDKEKGEETSQASRASGFKLGTIIDSKTRVISPKDPNRKSRWDQKESKFPENPTEDNESTPTTPKMMFFFGPGSLNSKPTTSIKPDFDKQENNVSSDKISTKTDNQSVKEEADKESNRDKLCISEETVENLEEKVPLESDKEHKKPEISKEELEVREKSISSPGKRVEDVDKETNIPNQAEKSEVPEEKVTISSKVEVSSPGKCAENVKKETNIPNQAEKSEVPKEEVTNSSKDLKEKETYSKDELDKLDEGESSLPSPQGITKDEKEETTFASPLQTITDVKDEEANFSNTLTETEEPKEKAVTSNEKLTTDELKNDVVPVSPVGKTEEKKEVLPTLKATGELKEKSEPLKKNIAKTEELKEEVTISKSIEISDKMKKEDAVEIVPPLDQREKYQKKSSDDQKLPKTICTASTEEKIDVQETINATGLKNKMKDEKNEPDDIPPENQQDVLQQKPENVEDKSIEATPVELKTKESEDKTVSSAENETSEPDHSTTVKSDEDDLDIDCGNSIPSAASDSESEKIEDKPSQSAPAANDSESKDSKSHASITNFTFDYDPSSPVVQPEIIARNLRKRGREAIESKPDIGETTEKKPKMKGKRTIDMNLRKSVEEKRQQDESSDENESIEVTRQESKGKGSKKSPKKQGSTVSDSDNASQKSDGKTKATNRNKRILKNLGVREEDIQAIAESPVPVRQSRRLAQLKIQQEAIRRRMDEEETVTKKKKKDDKDFKAGKRKRIEEEVKSSPTPPMVEKKKHKKKKKDKISIGWNTSSEDSDHSGKEDEEASEYEYEDHNEDVLEFKSDHEFSPESDLEGDEQLPLKRARTARKEESDDEDVDEEFPCQKCGKSDHPEWILLCDNCDNGWHCSCLRPALFVIPEGDWYCPTCQHETLLKRLQEKLHEFDKLLVKKEMEDRRKERLAYVGISLNNVLPTKEKRERKSNMGSEKSFEGESASESSSESKSESAESSDSDEPIYQLRQRRQAHSYKFQDYDDLINSALQEEPTTVVEKIPTYGRGKDIATIVNAAKEEEEKNEPNAFEDLPPVVPKETSISPKKKANNYRRKPRRLNNLELNSDDEADDSDEDFKGSSSNYSDEDDFDEESDDSFIAKKGSKASRRSTRARQKRFDKDFINDDTSDDSDIVLTRKKRRTFIDDDSESDVSDSWGKKKKKSSKKSKKKAFDDSDLDIYKRKKSKKFDSDDNIRGRRTRGKKTSYVLNELGSESEEEETVVKKAKGESDDDEEYVAEEEEEKEELEDEEEEEVENEEESEENEEESQDSEEDSDSKDPPPVIKKMKIIEKNSKQEESKRAEKSPEVQTIPLEKSDDVKELEKQALEKPPSVIVPMLNVEKLKESGLVIGNDDVNQSLNGNSHIKDNEAMLPETVPLKPLHEDPLKKLRTNRFFNKPSQPSTLTNVNNDDNDELSEPPGVGLPLFTEFGSSMPENLPTVLPDHSTSMPSSHPQLDSTNIMSMTNQIGYAPRPIQSLEAQPVNFSGDSSNNISPEGTPKKRRGRGKGKKTLAAEAAAAAAASSGTIGATVVNSVVESIPTNSNKPLVANIDIAGPPQPFSQSQPAPSVITRMLQAAPCKPSYPVGRIRPKQFAMIADEDGIIEPTEVHSERVGKEIIQHPPRHYGVPPMSGPCPASYYLKDGQPPHHFQHPHPQQGPPIHNFPSHSARPSHEQSHINPPPLNLAESTPYTGPAQPKFDPVTHRPFANPHTSYEYDYNSAHPPIMNTDEGLPQPAYDQSYPEHFDNSEGAHPKHGEDETGGEFGGLVSYFSSQHEDDLDS